MKLKRIELQGFKSFVDRTVLEFDQGITAILGPNGCGKSNIVDAVRWVLGEQSAKQLRGDRMDDVIFKGTLKRKPVSLAEVTLVFENEDRRLPVDFEEVAIKRRVTREGHSEYYLNGTACRLKDLRDLLFDSGVNNASYSIIEHAMINQVLNEQTQELRRMIEEGSGITKYKARRKETQRKLERTQQDLLRLNDIVEEIGREVRSLKYQVGKARRHQRLFQQIQALDLLIAGRQQQDFGRLEEDDRQRHAELQALAESETGELAELRAQIEATRPALDEREAERRQLEEAFQAYLDELRDSERQVLVLEHRIEEYGRRVDENQQSVADARRREGELHAQIAQIKEHMKTVVGLLEECGHALRARSEELALQEDALTRNRTALEQANQLNLEFIETDAAQLGELRELQLKRENREERSAVLQTEQQQIMQSRQDAEPALAKCEEDHARLTDRRRQLLAELAKTEREESDLEVAAADMQEQISARLAKREAAHSRHELLKRIKEEYEGYGQGARKLLQEHGGESRIQGSFADQIQVAEADLAAFETLFAELLDAIVVDSAGTAVDLVAELREQSGGRASFLCGRGLTEQEATPIPSVAGGRPALDLIQGSVAQIPHVQRLLANTLVFDDEHAAVAAAAAHDGPLPVICLCRSGLLITSDGIVRGGKGTGGDVSLLGRGEMLDKLAAEITELNRQVESAQQRARDNRSRRESARERLLHGRGELGILDEELNQVNVEIVQQRQRIEAARQRDAEIAQECTDLAEQIALFNSAEADLRQRRDESDQQRTDSTTRRSELQLSVVEAERLRDVSRNEVEQLRLQYQKHQSEKREAEASLDHLQESLAELIGKRERTLQEIDLGQRERESLTEDFTGRKQQLTAGFEERERRRQLVSAANDAIQVLHEKTAGWHDRIKEIQEKRNDCRERMHGIETDLAKVELKRANLRERIEEQYKGSWDDLIAALNREHLPPELERDGDVFQMSQATDLLTDRRQKLDTLGPINQLALEEYETKQERLTFLEGQRADVEKAKEDLTTAINRINRTARKLFSDTFEDVRRNFISVFQTLFEGGRADLLLLRTEDPLESNIQIVAQPRGKVVDHVSLLSGGERCLTALSLLFAVYLVKPSPFCMLDEVDAPLDDSNIQRFVRMLREFSRETQFLVVTHNKLTMETGNHLYGVTMMEEGCSSIVSVSFRDVAETQSDAELGRAIANRRRDLDRRESVRALLADEDEEAGAVRFTMSADEENGAPAEADPTDSSPDDTSEAREMEAEQ